MIQLTYFYLRFFWALCIAVSLAFCAVSSIKLYFDWTTSPVITNIDTTIEKVGNVKFPAFTVCNNNKADVDRLRR